MSLSDQKSALFGGGNDKKISGSAGAKSTPQSSSISTSVSKTNVSKTSGITTTKSSGGATSGTGQLSSAVKAKKIEEAQELSQKGMKAIKKTIFNWTPDHLMAASAFEGSANAYKTAGELELARMLVEIVVAIK
jgi:hypothetical protein